jgi:hypothetical protein
MNECKACGGAVEFFDLHCPRCGLNTKPVVLKVTAADNTQAGGDHYKTMAVQPWHVMEAILTHEEFVGYLKGNLIKYGMRQGKKDSPDAEKWHHYNQKLQEILNNQTNRK